MKSSCALTIIACLVLAGCGRATNSLANSPAFHIENVLAADRDISEKMSAELNAGVRKRIAVGNLVSNMQAIDTSGCPLDFRTAYLRHCQAWRAAHHWLASQPESDLEVLVDGFIKGLAGEFDLSNREGQAQHDAIRQTFEEVELSAVRHGARIKH
jgi:hypothetical protein